MIRKNYRKLDTCSNCKFHIVDDHPEIYDCQTTFCNLDYSFNNKLSKFDQFNWLYDHITSDNTICNDYIHE
jgi:hypothetical protein